MVCSFNWNVPPSKNRKTAEAVATQYIKAKYGITPAEFVRRVIAEHTPQNGVTSKDEENYSEKNAVARPPPKILALRQQFQARYNSFANKSQMKGVDKMSEYIPVATKSTIYYKP